MTDLTNPLAPVVITCNLHGEVVEVECAEEVTETRDSLTKCRVNGGNALPKALRGRENVVGKLSAAQVASIQKAQEKRQQRRK
jgi:hypothetical protein